MSRKHFKAFAESIACIKDRKHRIAATIAVLRVCKQFSDTFDDEKFINACNLTSAAVIDAWEELMQD